jgi:glycosyltransferase involved in cell wall biosynthesis
MSFPRARVALFNSADPRGLKVGGIETYVRDYIAYHPEDMEVLFIGPDEIGDLPPDEVTRVRFRGRSFNYLSLGRRGDSVNAYPTRIGESETLAFLRMMMRRWQLLRTTLKGRYSAEIRRVEYAPFVASLGVPFIQMLHLRGARKLPMSGLQNRLWPVTRSAEYVAAGLCQRFYTVNADLTDQLRRRSWPFAHKFATLTTWADPLLFKPAPFSAADETLHLVFAGRTDAFKQLGLMMQVVAQLRAMLPNRVAFHYIGDGDLTAYPEYAAIADISTNHGRRPAAQVAQLIARCSVGLLTSAFEGMPRFVLECLACGRPVVALQLPQLRAVVRPGVSGVLVPPGKDAAERMAQAVIEVWSGCRSGALTPQGIAKTVAPFRPQRILAPIWDDHRLLARNGLLTYPANQP